MIETLEDYARENAKLEGFVDSIAAEMPILDFTSGEF